MSPRSTYSAANSRGISQAVRSCSRKDRLEEELIGPFPDFIRHLSVLNGLPQSVECFGVVFVASLQLVKLVGMIDPLFDKCPWADVVFWRLFFAVQRGYDIGDCQLHLDGGGLRE